MRRGVVLIACLLLVMIANLACCYSVSAEDASSSRFSSTGTLVAVALETSGYRAQQNVLTQLKSMLEGLGTLFYLGCVFSALITIALSGKYSVALWFLVGPGLFHFLIKTTDTASGANWQFGVQKVSSTKVNEMVSGYGATTNSEVSWLFHHYNVFVSDIVQQLVSLFTNQSMMDRMKFTVRQEMYDDILGAEIADPKLQELINYTIGQCSKLLRDSEVIAWGKKDANFVNKPEYQHAKDRFDKQWSKYSVTIPAGSHIIDYLKNDLPKASQVKYEIAGSSKSPVKPIDFYSSTMSNAGLQYNNGEFQYSSNNPMGQGGKTVVGGSVSCDQLWTLMGIGVSSEALSLLKASDEKRAGNANAAALAEIHNDLINKMTAPPNLKALKFGESTTDNSGGNIPTYEIKTIKPDASDIAKVIEGHMLRKVFSNSQRYAALEQMFPNAGVSTGQSNFINDGKITTNLEQQAQFTNAMTNHAFGVYKQHELLGYAMALPYLQGIILYVLGLSFPFFALMVVLPGKANAFFAWMALWAWAKSWDVGWAMIMAVDNVLWEVMPHSSFVSPVTDPNRNPASVMESAFYGDTTYSLPGYYSLMAAMIFAVPTLTGHLILGSKSAMFGSVLSGLKAFSGNIATSMQKWVQADQAQELEFMRENHVMMKFGDFMNKAMKLGDDRLGELANDPSLSKEARELIGKYAELNKKYGARADFYASAKRGLFGLLALAPGANSYAIAGIGLQDTASLSKRDRRTRSDNIVRMKAIIAQDIAYHAQQDSEFVALDRMRAGVNLRGEFKLFADAPVAAYMEGWRDVIKQEKMFDVRRDAALGHMAGKALSAGWSVVKGK